MVQILPLNLRKGNFLPFLTAFLLTLSTVWQAGAQINYSFNFDANSTGWTGNFSRFTGTTACGGSGGSMRRNIYTPTIGSLISPLTGVSTGAQATISYTYKVANWSGNTVATPAPWGTISVQYGATATGPWTTFATVTDETQLGNACIPKSHTFVPPSGSNVFIRFQANWSAGDYFLNFDNIVVTQPLNAPCSGTPSPGNTISSANPVCPGVNFTLSLQNFTTGSDVTYQWQSADDVNFTVNLTNLGTSATQVTSQTSGKYYRCIVTCPSSGSSTNSNPVQVNMQPIANLCLNYCVPTMTSGCTDGDVIARVILNTLDNNSGTGCPSGTLGYSNYVSNPALTTTLLPSTTYSCEVFAGQYNGNYAAWIDYNDDGVFDNATERVGYTTTPVLGSGVPLVLGSSAVFPVVISCTPPPGPHRLRVREVYNTSGININPCTNNQGLGYGEVEDYLITIAAPPACPSTGNPTVSSTTSYTATLSVPLGCSSATSFDVEYGAPGFTPGSGTIEANIPATISGTDAIIVVSNLFPLTTYQFYVRANCGANGTSAWSFNASGTTLQAPCDLVAPGITSSTANPACAGVDFTLSIANPSTDLGITYQWESADDNAFTVNVTSLGTAETQVTSQTSAKYYRCLMTCLLSGNSQYSTPVYVTMNAPNQCYCTPPSTNGCSFGDLIASVVLNTLSNSDPTCTGSYKDFTANTSLTTTLLPSTTYTCVIGTAAYAQNFAVWIDYNDNGLFENSERVGYTATAVAANSTASFPVAISCTPPVGTHRMRVRSAWSVEIPNGINITPCLNQNYGETEDYLITIASPPTCPSMGNPSTVSTTAYTATISFPLDCSAATNYDVEYGAPGFTLGTGTVQTNLVASISGSTATLEIPNLMSLTTYSIYVRANCGGGDVSGWSFATSATTQQAPCNLVSPGSTVSSSPAVCTGVNFTLSMSTPSSDLGLTYQWEAADDSLFTVNPVALGSAVTQVTSQTAAKYYRCLVTCSISGNSQYTAFLYVPMEIPTQCYCIPTTTFGCTDGDVIARVVLNTLDNSSGTGCPSGTLGYSNYTTNSALTTTLLPSSTYACKVFAGQYSQGYAAWIDYNDDGLFDNTTERIGYSNGLVAGSGFVGVLGDSAVFPISLSCTPPAGVHRLRIRSMFNTDGINVTPCTANSYGEVEDYLITIAAPPACPSAGFPSVTGVTSNSATLTFALNCSSATNFDVEYGPTGFTQGTGTIVTNLPATVSGGNASITIPGLSPQLVYQAYMRANCGSNGQSLWSAPVTILLNDVCEGAMPVVCGQTVTANNNIYATESATSGDYRSAWYSVTSLGGNVIASLCSGTAFDSYLRVFTGSCGSLTEIAFNDDACGSQSQVTFPTTTGTVYYIQVGGYSNFSTGNFSLSISCPSINTWTGVSQDWSSTSNWTSGIVPACGDNIVIPNTANDPVIAVPSTCGNITLGNGVDLTLNGANLTVCGNWISNGSTTVGSGNVVLTGNGSAQTISGTTQFKSVTINNSNGVSLLAGAQVNISEALNLQLGAYTSNLGTTTLLSTALATAYINDFASGYTGTYVGNVTANRFVSNGVTANDQHFIGSPVANTSIAELADDIALPGINNVFVTPSANCSADSLLWSSNYGNVFEWVENVPNPSCLMSGWRVRSAGNLTTGRGYSAYLPSAFTFDITGSPNTGDKTVNLTNSGYGNGNITGYQTFTVSSGWNLLSNPFPSSMVLTNLPAGIDPTIQIWQTSGVYRGTYLPQVIGAGASLAPFQGFFVRTTLPANSYTFLQSDRSTSQVTFYSLNGDHTLQLDVNGNGFSDFTVIDFNTNATGDYDLGLDAEKFLSRKGQPTIYTEYTQSAFKPLAKNTLTNVSATPSVPLGLIPGNNGQFSITASQINTFDPTTYIRLEDKLTGTFHDLRQNSTYSFTASTADNNDRFVVHFTPAIDISSIAATCELGGKINLNQDGPAVWNYAVTNAQNAVVGSGVVSESSPAVVQGLPAGLYTITLLDNNGYSVMKNIIVSGTPAVLANFNTSNSLPLTNESVTFTSTATNVTSYEWNFGDGTIINGVANPNHAYAEPGIYQVTLTVTSPEGCTNVFTQTIEVQAMSSVNGVMNSSVDVNAIGDRVQVTFNGFKSVNAQIRIFNVIGQELLNERFTQGNVFSHQFTQLDAAYLLVTVKQDGITTTRKVLVTAK